MNKWALISAAVVALAGVIDNSQAMPPDRLREKLLEAVARVKAFRIEYESIVPRGAIAVHATVAMKEPNSLYHWIGKFHAGAPVGWREHPMQQRSIISGERRYWEFPMRRAFRLRRGDDTNLFPGSLPRELLWSIMVWWPLTRESNRQFGDEPFVVIDVLESEKYVFRKELEDVDGIQCYVLECPGRSTLWFDANRIGVLMAREIYNEENRKPVWRAELSKHKEVKPGIWCPMEFKHIAYDSNAPSEEARRIRIIEPAFRVVDARFNEDVPEEMFEIPEPQPGTIQSFEDGSWKQVVPGGYDYMDGIADWIERTANDPPEAKLSATELICHVAVVLVSLYIIYRCWKWRPAGKREREAVAATDVGY